MPIRNYKWNGTGFICARDPTHPLDQTTKLCATCYEISQQENLLEEQRRAKELIDCQNVTCPNCNHTFQRPIPDRFRDIYEDDY